MYSRRLFFVFSLVPVISIAALFATVALDGRDDVTQQMRQSNTNLANTVEENIRRTLDFYDRALLGVREEVSNPAVLALPEEMRQKVVFDRAVVVPGVTAIAVADVDGRVIVTSTSPPTKEGLSVADRPYFRHHRDSLDTGLDISGPLISRLDNEVSMILTRRIDGPNHSFAGVVILSLKVRSLDDLFNAINLAGDSRITLVRDGGTVFSRYPPDIAPPVLSLAGASIYQRFTAGENHFESTSPIDGVNRFYVAKHFSRYPLSIIVAEATEEAYAGWRQRTIGQGIITLILIAVCLAFAWLFLRELEIRQKTADRLRHAERDLRTILNGLPSLVAYWDKHLLIRFANNKYLQTFSAESDAAGKPIGGLQEGQRLIGKNAVFFEQALGGHRQEFETSVITAQGKRQYLLVSFVPDIEADVVVGVFVQATDISERKMAEDLLFEEKERFRVTLTSIGDAVVSTDSKGKVTYINSAAEIMLGYDLSQATGLDAALIVPLFHEENSEALLNPVQETLLRNQIVKGTSGQAIFNKHSERIEVENTATPIRDRNDQVTGAVMVLRDVTEARALITRLAHLAQYDPLTALPNRNLLSERSQQAILRATREKQKFAFIYLDLDGFKDINDSLGHDVGDKVLIEFARRLKTALRASDTLSRQGGDEFVVLASTVNGVAAATALASKLIALASTPFEVGENILHLTASLGVAIFPQDGESLDLLSRHADAAMYAAKRSGKNTYRFYSAEIQTHVAAEFNRHKLID